MDDGEDSLKRCLLWIGTVIRDELVINDRESNVKNADAGLKLHIQRSGLALRNGPAV